MTTFEQKHGRPKPPRMGPRNAWYRAEYEEEHEVLGVYRTQNSKKWEVTHAFGSCGKFPTHAEAVQYAHKLAQERRSQ